jgi:hypothetical protein
MLGFNYCLSEISAAVGIEQFRQIDPHVASRQRYDDVLCPVTEALRDHDIIILAIRCRLDITDFEPQPVIKMRDVRCFSVDQIVNSQHGGAGI